MDENKNMATIYCFIYLFSMLTFAVSGVKYEAVQITQLIEDGKNEYNKLEQRSSIPQFGVCWKDAVLFLHQGCKHLTDDVQSVIALKFTDCFLKMSGHDPYECEQKPSKKQCIKSMTDRAFNAYTEFYTHTHNICYFLESQVWHEETEKTIDRLSTSSAHVTKQLKEAEVVQIMLLEQQKKSMSVQQELLENGLSLSEILHSSQDNLHAIMQEFRTSTLEQRRILFEVFDRLASLQAWAVGEISWLDTIIFYVTCIIVTYIITATPRTNEARIWIFLIVTANALFERCVVACLLQDNTDHIDVFNENLNWWIWQVRKVMLAVCAVWLGVAVYKYCDYSAANHKLLLDIHKQNLEVIRFLERIRQVNNRPSSDSDVLTVEKVNSYAVRNTITGNSNGRDLTEQISDFPKLEIRNDIKRSESSLSRSSDTSSKLADEVHKTRSSGRITEIHNSLPKIQIQREVISPPRPSSRSSVRSSNSTPTVYKVESPHTFEVRSPNSGYNLRRTSRTPSIDIRV